MWEDNAILDLQADERVIYRTRGGRLSFFRFLPASSIIATDKRFFVLRPFSKKRSYLYENISSIGIRSGLFDSKFIIKTANEKKDDFKTVVTFYSKGRAMAFFSVVSNRIHATKDPYHKHKEEAHAMNSVYKALSKNNMHMGLTADVMPNVSKFARFEKDGTIKVQRSLVVEKEIQKPEESEAEPVQQISSTTQLEAAVSSFTQKTGKPPKNVEPENDAVGYFVGGKEIRAKTYKGKREGARERADFDPDRDLRIFSARKIRDADIKGSSSGKKRVNPFNIPDAK
jgi:hypothetical protein